MPYYIGHLKRDPNLDNRQLPTLIVLVLPGGLETQDHKINTEDTEPDTGGSPKDELLFL